MKLKRIFLLIYFIFFSIGLFASDVPIIFVHGHKSEARPEGTNEHPNWKDKGGWGTWYPRNRDGGFAHPTAMTKIADSHYGGYQYGLKANGSPAITCDNTTQLQLGQGTKRIFNFSWYSRDGSPGVMAT